MNYLCIAGPTAAGKSAAAMAVADALAASHPVEIVSVDSALVYRGLDIGTAKPSAAERARVPHHLIDIIDASQAYSAARFVGDATRLIGEIAARGRLPLLVGGTMLYFKALFDGLDAMPAADRAVRAALAAQAARDGAYALYEELQRVDPVTAARLPPGDSQRIQRALEVWELTGQRLSSLQGRRAGASGLAFLPLLILPQDRALLHARIARRFEGMLADGLIEELRSLRQRYSLNAELPAMRAVGYRQAWHYLEGELDARLLRERGIEATRQLAKRQITWLRATDGERFDAFGETLFAALEDRLVRWRDRISAVQQSSGFMS